MARIAIDNGVLTVHMRGIDKILAIHGNISVPLSHIQGVDVRPDEAFKLFHGLRVGTNIPHVVTAGTFFNRDSKLFFDIHDPERSIAINLEHDNYSRLIVEVGDDETPESAAERIRAAL
jgi:hypothetical protein